MSQVRPAGTRVLAMLLALVAPVASTAGAAPAIEVTTHVTRADALEVRLQGDAAALARCRIVGGANRVRVWLGAIAAPRTLTFAKGPANRVSVRRRGKHSVVSIHTRNEATAQARRVRVMEAKGALTIALFSNDGALAEWIAAHAGARIRPLPGARLVAAQRDVARRTDSPTVHVGVPTLLPAGAATSPQKNDAGETAAASPVLPPVASPVPSIAQIAQAAAEATAPIAAPPALPTSVAPPTAPSRRPVAPTAAVVPAPAPRESDRTRAAILGVLLLLGAAAVWIRRRAGRLPGEEASIRVLSSRGLGGKHRVSVLEVGSDRFLVAMDPGGTRLISRLDVAQTRPSAAPAAAPADRELLMPAPTLTRTAAAPAPARALGSAFAAEPGLHPRLTLVGPARIEPETVAQRRARTLTPAVADVSLVRAPAAARSVPLASLATHAVPASPPPALRPVLAHPRTRVAPEPSRTTSATGATVLAAAAEPLYETDVEGLLRLRSAARKAA